MLISSSFQRKIGRNDHIKIYLKLFFLFFKHEKWFSFGLKCRNICVTQTRDGK